jgi:serine protease inhibitor
VREELIITSDGEDKGGNTVQPQRIFTANHPFVYMITEKTTGAILFLGQFCGE